MTGTCLGYPVRPGIYGMRMTLFEYSGAHGFELCDQICQADITGTTAIATTNFELMSNDELAISAIVGDMSSATVPNGWNSRLADAPQGCYIADTLSSGGSSAGSPLSAAWTGLTRSQRGRGSPCHVCPAWRGVAQSAVGAVELHGFRHPPRGIGSRQVDFTGLPRRSGSRQHARCLHERIDLPPSNRVRVGE